MLICAFSGVFSCPSRMPIIIRHRTRARLIMTLIRQARSTTKKHTKLMVCKELRLFLFAQEEADAKLVAPVQLLALLELLMLKKFVFVITVSSFQELICLNYMLYDSVCQPKNRFVTYVYKK